MALNKVGKADIGLIKTLKETELECSRCGEVVTQFYNIGRFKCRMIKSNGHNGFLYVIPCDHGDVEKKPVFYMPDQLETVYPKLNPRAKGGRVVHKKTNRVYRIVHRYLPGVDPNDDAFSPGFHSQ